MKKTPLQKIAQADNQSQSAHGIIKLLIADHKLMRDLMKKIKSKQATPAQIKSAYKELIKTVASHVTAEEKTFLSLIKDNPVFEDMALEGYEEHRVHETVINGIKKVKDQKRQIEQMKIFCEILEHHLDEEEEDLFPRFRNYAAKATKKKIGKKFLAVRKKTNKTGKNKGATRFA